MCYATKRKIADCVKQLMRKKEIRKITIQDVMDATSMSRQSFYYHFKDIYDVIEWIARYDFTERIMCEQDQLIEDWALLVMRVLEDERPFFERVVNQIEWPKLVPVISGPIEEQMRLILQNQYKTEDCLATVDFCLHFVTNAYCYYMLDYIYHKKHVTNEQVREEVGKLVNLVISKPLSYSDDMPEKRVRMVG